MAFLLSGCSRTGANKTVDALWNRLFSRGQRNWRPAGRGLPRTVRGQAEDGGDQVSGKQNAADGE
ncbi:MAG: hypothetical protein WA949_19345 [Phormidesmis sp.]